MTFHSKARQNGSDWTACLFLPIPHSSSRSHTLPPHNNTTVSRFPHRYVTCCRASVDRWYTWLWLCFFDALCFSGPKTARCHRKRLSARWLASNVWLAVSLGGDLDLMGGGGVDGRNWSVRLSGVHNLGSSTLFFRL